MNKNVCKRAYSPYKMVERWRTNKAGSGQIDEVLSFGYTGRGFESPRHRSASPLAIPLLTPFLKNDVCYYLTNKGSDLYIYIFTALLRE